MSSKRILIVHDDRLVANLYREKLEGAGFIVDSTRNLDQVPKLLESKKPDVLLMDLVLQSGSGVELIKSLRCQPETLELPVLVFFTSIGALNNAAMQAGATSVIARGTYPVASVIDTVKTALGMPGLGAAADALVFRPDEAWIQMVNDSAAEHLNLMRHCLPGLVTSSIDLKTLRSLWALVHGFAEKAMLISNKPLSLVASAFDMLLCELNETPEQVNQSTLRTVGQAIDFLQTLTAPGLPIADADPKDARVLIIDDESSAQQFIGAAVTLAGLQPEWAGTPDEALSKVQTGRSVNLIFLDVGLPDMNGFELCTKIRGIDGYEKTPIIFLTGMATFQNKAQASLAGGNDFVAKPCSISELAVKSLIWLFRGRLKLM